MSSVPRTYRRSFDLAEARASLAATPALLRTWLGALPPGWDDAREGEGTWSPREVVAHLAHGERTDWIPRARRILEHGEGLPFEPFDRSAHLEEAAGSTVSDVVDAFERARADSLADLDALALTEADLDRRGRHPALGVVTLRQLLATWVAHDLDHVMQIARVLGRQYTDEVGPWSAYLRVISGRQG